LIALPDLSLRSTYCLNNCIIYPLADNVWIQSYLTPAQVPYNYASWQALVSQAIIMQLNWTRIELRGFSFDDSSLSDHWTIASRLTKSNNLLWNRLYWHYRAMLVSNSCLMYFSIH
jgi:hypothetical protein